LKHFSAPYIIFHFSSLVSKSSKPGCIYLWSWSWSFDTKGKGSQRTVSAVILAELEWSTTDLSYLTLSTCPGRQHPSSALPGSEAAPEAVILLKVHLFTVANASPSHSLEEPVV